MKRIAITMTAEGLIESIVADDMIEIYIIAPHAPDDRVYAYGSARFGAALVNSVLGDDPVGHANDGKLAEVEEDDDDDDASEPTPRTLQ